MAVPGQSLRGWFGGGHVRQVISDTERESLLSPKMLQAMRDADKLDRAPWLQEFSFTGIEPRREAVRGSYGPRLRVRFLCYNL